MHAFLEPLFEAPAGGKTQPQFLLGVSLRIKSLLLKMFLALKISQVNHVVLNINLDKILIFETLLKIRLVKACAWEPL